MSQPIDDYTSQEICHNNYYITMFITGVFYIYVLDL